MFGKEVLTTRLFFIMTHSPFIDKNVKEEEKKKKNKMLIQKNDVNKTFREFVGAENPFIYFINTKSSKKYRKVNIPAVDKLINQLLKTQRLYCSIQTQCLKNSNKTQETIEKEEAKTKMNRVIADIKYCEEEKKDWKKTGMICLDGFKEKRKKKFQEKKRRLLDGSYYFFFLYQFL